MGKVILETEGLSKRFCRRPEYALRYATQDMWRELRGLPPADTLRPGEFWALRDVDLQLEQGEVLGVVGHNGAGKSTLINLIAGLIRPTRGCIRLYTDRVALMDHQGGLNMVETGRENVAIQLALHGCPDERIQEESEHAIAFAELGDFIDAAVGTYSLGMRLRLAFSIYTRLKPDLFIVDEALSAGDIRFRQRFQSYLRGYIDNGGSILFCSHDLFTVQTLCKRSMLMDRGCLRMYGDTLQVLKAYQDLMEDKAPTENEVPIQLSEQQLADEAELLGEAVQQLVSHSETPDAPQDSTASTAPPDKQSIVTHNGMPVIESIVLSPLEGDVLIPGEPAMLELICNAPQTFGGVTWSIEIGKGELPSLVTLIGGYGEKRYSLEAGRNHFCGKIERLPFAPGHYELRTMVNDSDTGAVLASQGYRTPPAQFQVINLADKVSNMMAYRKNIIHMTVDWS